MTPVDASGLLRNPWLRRSALLLLALTALVLADEPSGNLDTENADAVFDLMRNVNETGGTTFLIVTHDPRLAQRCDRIIELVDGRVVEDRSNPNVVRRG